MSGDPFINLFKIYEWSREENGLVLIHKLMDFGVFAKEGTVKCAEGHTCALVPYQRSIDGYCWRCRSAYVKNHKKRRHCDFIQSLRKNTFFSKSHLTLQQICAFVNLWCHGSTLHLTIIQANISQKTAVDWASFCREVAEYFLITNKKKLGGPGTIVEIDESKFGRRKYHRGHRVEGQWVFGGIQRETGDCFLVPVQDRTSSTLVGLIKDWILPGTTIISDCWKAYDVLQDSGFNHLKVNHSVSFVDEETGAHTNTIESTWRHVKSSLPVYNRRKNFFSGYLAKFIFLKRCKMLGLDPTEEFFKWAGKLYNPLETAEQPVSESSDQEDGEDEDYEQDAESVFF